MSCLVAFATKHDNSSQHQVKKHLLNAKLKVTYENGTCGLGFSYMTKSETLNGWRCLDEENKMDEKNQPM